MQAGRRVSRSRRLVQKDGGNSPSQPSRRAVTQYHDVMIPEKILWKVYAGALGAVTTIVSQKVVEGVWKYVTGDDETPQPDDPEVSTTKALSWALASGIGIAGSQLLMHRFVNKRWMKFSSVNPITGKDFKDKNDD